MNAEFYAVGGLLVVLMIICNYLLFLLGVKIGQKRPFMAIVIAFLLLLLLVPTFYTTYTITQKPEFGRALETLWKQPG